MSRCFDSGIPSKGFWDLSQKMLRIMSESHACFCISDSIQSFLQRKEELLETLRTILGCKLLSKFCNTVILGTGYMYQFNTWCFAHSYSKSHVHCSCSWNTCEYQIVNRYYERKYMTTLITYGGRLLHKNLTLNNKQFLLHASSNRCKEKHYFLRLFIIKPKMKAKGKEDIRGRVLVVCLN